MAQINNNGKFSLTELTSDYRFNGIDIIKLICAYLVCIIHITPVMGVEFPYAFYINFILQNGICRIAVPFFFCASGFLLFRKVSLKPFDRERVKRYCFKNLRLLGLWTVLLICGNTTQLWYLGGLVIAAVIVSFWLQKAYSAVKIAVLSVVLYLVGLCFDSYFGIIEKISDTVGFSMIPKGLDFVFNNFSRIFILGLFSSVIFFGMGALFAYKPIKMRLFVAWIGLLLSWGLLMAEAFILKKIFDPLDYNMYLSLIPSTFFLFYIASHIRLKDRPIYEKLRKISILVFFLHQLVRRIIDWIFEGIHAAFGVELSCAVLLSTIILVTALAVLIERLSEKEKCRWLKYLYS